MILAMHPECWLLAAVLALGTTWAHAAPPSKATRTARLDHSGLKRVGMASYYGQRFSGRTMADGTRMRPESDNAASRTLPLGTTALVTNLRDGRTALVTIRDRGPYIKGRIIDVSPRTAKLLGMLDAGVVQVEVAPLTVPQPNGERTLIAALADAKRLALPR